MSKVILVTGTKGFLGRYTAKHFKSIGYKVIGIGHGVWTETERQDWGVDVWIQSSICLEVLRTIDEKLDLIVHCGGSGSVGFSMQNPMQDFQKTVDGTLEVLEYVRLFQPQAKIIYPSSPAVQGVHDDSPIKEGDESLPVSVYGVHKKMAEELCISYSKNFDLKVSIIRFFSIYGEGLRKQLLWDACNKITQAADGKSEFWGIGDETRDWIYIIDAVRLIEKVASYSDMPKVINGGTGHKFTIEKTISFLHKELGSESRIVFNGQTREGDPKFFWADTYLNRLIGWQPQTTFEEGVRKYIKWFKKGI